MARNLDRRLWEQARKAALARDGHRCQAGERYGTLRLACDRVDVDVHHLVRPEDGGDRYDLGNLLTLCKKHHTRLHLTDERLRNSRKRRVRQRPNAAAYQPFAG